MNHIERNYIPQVDDKVEVQNFSHEHNGKQGWVVSIDGGYVYVKLRWQRHPWDLALLQNEIRPLKKNGRNIKKRIFPKQLIK